MILTLLACTSEKPLVVTTELTPSPAITTVATLAWTADAPLRARVRYGTAARTLETPLSDASTTSEAVLVGVPASTDVAWELVDESDAVLASGNWTTGALPTDLPTLTATGAGNDRFVFTPLLGGTTAAVLLTPEGAIAWYHLEDRDLDVYRVRPARDGSGVYYNAASVSGDPAEDSAIVHVSWDGTVVTERPVPLLAHDFVERDDGTLAALQVRYDGDLRGDAIVEVAADGALTDVWTSWVCFDPAVTPGDEPTLGWTFANALDLDAATDHYLVGMRNLSSIAWVDRATGTCDRVLGGDRSDYTFDGGRFLHQHQFDAFADDRVLVFDNDGAGGTASRAIEYALVDGVATEVWSHTPSPSVYSFVLGDVARLDDGDTFIAWSVAGQLDRVPPAGGPTWSVNTDVGYAFGFVTLAEAPLP